MDFKRFIKCPNVFLFLIFMRLKVIYSEEKYYKSCDFKNCLCSYNKETNRYYLYCNDPNLTKIPDFTAGNRSNLIFTKLDFSNSGIERIATKDFDNLKLDISNGNPSENITEKLKTETFEALLEHLKKSMPPTYHLDFDNVNHIETGAFRDLVINSFKLASKKIGSNYLHLNLRLQNSRFNYTARERPFQGLIAKELHLKNVSDSFLMESIFRGSIFSEMTIENSPDLTGFLIIDSNLSSGVLLHKLTIFKSFNMKHLAANMLPSFVQTFTFNEIIIKNCKSLEHLNGFTFSKYPHLKKLYLSWNNFKTMDRYSFQGLSSLEILDLSSNPLQSIEEYTFRDCKSLKYLHLESTSLRMIQRDSFRGLISLIRLKLSRSFTLETIEGRAFEDSNQTLKELNLKDTSINLIEELQKSTALNPPYIRGELTQSDFWLEGLNLTLLNIDLVPNNSSVESFDNYTKSFLLCKMKRYLSNFTLVNLPRNQNCDSFVYFIYRRKDFGANWEYQAPVCYRSQIILENGTKSYKKIVKKENEFKFSLLNVLCYKIKIQTTTRQTVEFPIPGEVHQLPKLDLFKLMYVALVLLGLTGLFIFIIRCIYRVKHKLREISKRKTDRSNALRTSSSSSSNNLNFNLVDSSSKKSLILPPSVIPKFSTRIRKQPKQTNMMNISKLMLKNSLNSNSSESKKTRVFSSNNSQSSLGPLPTITPLIPGRINVRKIQYSTRPSFIRSSSFNNSELESLQGIREDTEVYGTEI